jgi:hypothetical protein
MQLLRALAPAFPPGVQVLVDHGLYSPELFEYISEYISGSWGRIR